MKTIGSKLVASACMAMLLLAGRPAAACWDGFAAGAGNVSIRQGGDDQWHAEKARELAAWLPRIDALLPADTHLESEHGLVSLVPSAGGPAIAEARWTSGKLADLFTVVARVAPGARARIAKGHAIVPFTVQVLGVRDPRRAAAFADALNERSDRDELVPSVGFYSAGGFPAIHPVAHVLEAPKAGDDDDLPPPLTRVVVGSYLDAASAQVTAAALTAHGIPAFVRVL